MTRTIATKSGAAKGRAKKIRDEICAIAAREGVDARLPSENELCSRFGVSRTLLREVLGSLEGEGVIVKHQGKGTFVSSAGLAAIQDDKKSAAQTVGMFVQNPGAVNPNTDLYFHLVSAALKEEFSKQCPVMLLEKDPLEVLEREVLEYNIKGAVFPNSVCEDYKKIQTLIDMGVKVVVIHCDSHVRGAMHVYFDQWSTGFLAAKKLIDIGCRQFGFVGLRKERLSANERYKGFVSALQMHGITIENSNVFRVDGYFPECGVDAGKVMFASETRPDGVFAVHDNLAMGVIRAAADAGLAVPRDLAVIGCGDYGIAEHFVPRLTSIHFDPGLLGKEAAGLLKRMMFNPDSDELNDILLGVNLVERESTKGFAARL